MNRQQLFEKLEAAYDEMVDLIEQSSERGQFNSLYFRKPFLEWYTKQLDSVEEQDTNE